MTTLSRPNASRARWTADVWRANHDTSHASPRVHIRTHALGSVVATYRRDLRTAYASGWCLAGDPPLASRSPREILEILDATCALCGGPPDDPDRTCCGAPDCHAYCRAPIHE